MSAWASPLIGFPALWLLAVALAQIHVLRVQTPWSATAWITILLVPAMFVLGGVAAKLAVDARARLAARGGGAVRRRRLLLLALLVIGFAELAREFAGAGAIPLLSRHIDQARVSIHPGALGLLLDALTVAAIVALATPARLLARAAVPELAIATLALGGFALSGGRQAAAVAVAGLIARVLYWGAPRLRTVALTAVAGIALFGLVFYVRTGQELGQPFSDELYGHVLPGAAKPLVPLLPAYFALAINPVVLAKVIAYFPGHMAYGYGRYDAGAVHSIVHALSLGSITARLSPPWVVATAAGPLWADGGLVAVLPGFALIGAITTAPYALFRRSRRFTHAILAGYFVSIALYCVYDNLLTQYKDWVFVAAGLLLAGRLVESGDPRPRTEPGGAGPALRALPAVAGAGALALLVAVVAVAERNVSRSHETLAGSLAAGARDIRQLTPYVAEADFRAAPAVAALLSEPLAAGPAGRDGQALWAFTRRRGALSATPLEAVGASLRRGHRVRLPGPIPPGSLSFRVGRWGPRGLAAAFVTATRRGTVSMAVFALGGASRLLARFRLDMPAATGAPATSAPATSAPATSAPAAFVVRGGAPVLTVVHRGEPDQRVHVERYDRAGAPARSYVSVRQGRGFPAGRWLLLFGPAAGRDPDLAFVGSGSASARAPLELHVMLGASGYRAFGAQTEIGITVGAARRLRFVAGATDPGFVLYAVDRRRGAIRELLSG